MKASGNHLKITLNSPVILGFTALCIIVMLMDTISGGVTTSLLFSNYRSSLKEPLTYLRFFSHVLGHGSWDHLVSNLSYILLLGPLLEEKYGGRVIAEIMVIVAGVTGLFNFIVFPSCALLGASGICFAFILLSSFTSVRKGEIPVTFLLVAAVYLGQQVYDGIMVADNVANFAHIIGGIVGAGAGFAMISAKGR